MINQDRVREMNKMAILESGVGEKELKISTYRRADFVILQLVKGFVAGTVCFAAIVMLWLCSKWDDLNQFCKCRLYAATETDSNFLYHFYGRGSGAVCVGGNLSA